MLDCQNCGHTNPLGAKYCNNCGTPLNPHAGKNQLVYNLFILWRKESGRLNTNYAGETLMEMVDLATILQALQKDVYPPDPTLDPYFPPRGREYIGAYYLDKETYHGNKGDGIVHVEQWYEVIWQDGRATVGPDQGPRDVAISSLERL